MITLLLHLLRLRIRSRVALSSWSSAIMLPRVPEVDADVDGQLGRLPGLGETAEGPERLLQMGNGLAVGGPRQGPEPRLAQIGDRLLPQLPAQGVVGQPLGLLGDALGREPLDGLGDSGVQGALPVVLRTRLRG